MGHTEGMGHTEHDTGAHGVNAVEIENPLFVIDNIRFRFLYNRVVPLLFNLVVLIAVISKLGII